MKSRATSARMTLIASGIAAPCTENGLLGLFEGTEELVGKLLAPFLRSLPSLYKLIAMNFYIAVSLLRSVPKFGT